MIRIFALVALLAIVAWRGYSIYTEGRRGVFNATRIANTDGASVEFIVAETSAGELKYPVFIKNNTAFVSRSRRDLFRVGMSAGGGTVRGVSQNIDLDTGLYRVTFSGAADGQTFAVREISGIFVPADAIFGDHVFIIQNGAASMLPVKIIASDNDFAVVSGIDTGAKIITTPISDGVKVKE
ncbi:MAG: hypothetical protein LBR41_03400 [Rickettsiales bacterium]|nr:hypothetical protein [Rickettsiales bacterium]